MSELAIGLLDAEVADPRHTDPQRVDRLLRQVAWSRLDDRWAGQHGRAGEWCVRRIDVELQLDPGEQDTAAAARWAEQIACAVEDLVADGRTVIHYSHRALAVADAVRSAATGSDERAWAWRQLGVLGPDDPEPASDPAGALLAVLAREPAAALPALADTAARGGLAGLDRLLGESGWRVAAGVVAPATALHAALVAVDPLAAAQVSGVASFTGRRAPNADGAPVVGARATAAAARARARAVIAGSRLLGAVLGAVTIGQIRPTAAVVAAWAVLGTVEVEPHRPATATATAVAAELAGAVTGHAAVGPGRATGPVADPAGAATPSPDPPAAMPATAPVARVAAPPRQPDDSAARPSGLGAAEARPVETGPVTAAVPIDGRVEGVTEWAGLVFLLNSAAAAGLPEVLDADVRLVARPLSWVVHQLGQRVVPVPAADPAALALAGLAPDAALPAGDEPSPDEEIALTGHAERWAAVTLAALTAAVATEHPPTEGWAADPETDTAGAAPTLWALARRPGRILADPGWLEVHLALDTVDVTVRRAGLDVDPGWVDWLGAVVRICYG